jgi:hypothetical protein
MAWSVIGKTLCAVLWESLWFVVVDLNPVLGVVCVYVEWYINGGHQASVMSFYCCSICCLSLVTLNFKDKCVPSEFT